MGTRISGQLSSRANAKLVVVFGANFDFSRSIELLIEDAEGKETVEMISMVSLVVRCTIGAQEGPLQCWL